MGDPRHASRSRTRSAIPVEFGTADDCLFEFGRLEAGEHVLVQAGAGGVGLAAIQLAKAAGATVSRPPMRDGRLERLHDYGLDHGIDYTEQDVPAEIMRLTDGRGVDLVVDPIGGRTLEGSIAALAYRGRISWMGNAGRDDQPPRHLAAHGEERISHVPCSSPWSSRSSPSGPTSSIAKLIERIGRGELRAVVDRTFPLADAAEAHRYVEAGTAFGRVVILP